MKHCVRAFLAVCLSVSFLAPVLSGCGKPKDKGDRVVATVNGEKVTVKEFRKSLDQYYARDPLFKVTPRVIEDQIGMLVDKRILIQEAMKKKLNEREKFVNTIKAFWEQTLIRDLVEDVEKRLASSVNVDESDMRGYYSKMSTEITFRILRDKNKGALTKLLSSPPEGIAWEERIGPVSYEDTNSGVVQSAFDIPQGNMEVLGDANYNYLVYVTKKEAVSVRPYDELKEGIRQKIRTAKLQAAFKEWLMKLKVGAKIDVDRKAVRELEYSHGQ